MATLAISIDLSQVQQAQGQFEKLMSGLHLEAMKGLLKIQGEFDKGIKLTGFERSLDTFIKLLSEFESYAKITFQYVRSYFAARPNLQGYREALAEFKTISGDFVKVGKQTAKDIGQPFAAGGRQFTPVIDLQRVTTSKDKFKTIMDKMHDNLELTIRKMIREWDKYNVVINLVVTETRIMVYELKQAFDALGPIGILARSVSTALRQMGVNARTAGTGLNSMGGGLKNVIVATGQGVTVTGNFNRSLNGVQQAAKGAVSGVHAYRDSLLGLFFLIDGINVSALWDKMKMLGKDLMANQMSMDSTMSTLRVAFQTAEQAAIEYERIRQLSTKIGVNTMEMAMAWARTSAAAAKSGLFGKTAFTLFSGVSMAAAVMGQDPAQGLRAIEQIFSKNQLSMEEIRQQMSERLPGSVKIFEEAAKKMGTTLDDVVKNTGTGFGKMNSVIMEAGEELIRRYGTESEKNAHRLRGSLAGLQNAWDELLTAMNSGGFNQALVDGIQALTRMLNEPETVVAMRAFGKALGVEIPKAVNAIAPALKLLRDNFGLVLEAILLVTAALTGAMKGGLVGLALAPFTQGMSIPVGVGVGAAAGIGVGLGLTRGIPEELLTVFDGIVIAGKMLLFIFNQLYENLVYLRLAVQTITFLVENLGTILSNLGGFGILTNLGKLGQLAGGQKPGEVSGVAGASGALKGIIDEYYKSLEAARTEQEKVRLAREAAAKNLLPHPAAGTDDPGINPELLRLQKKTDTFIRKQQAQIDEMNNLLNGVQTITQEVTNTAVGTGRTLNDLQKKIHAVAVKHGIDPNMFEAIIKLESSYNPRAKGSSGEIGLTQLMESNRKRFKVTDPYNVDEQLRGGAELIQYLTKKFGGDMSKVIPAYNAGEGNVQRGTIPKHTSGFYVPTVMKYYNEFLKAGGGGGAETKEITTTLGKGVTSEDFARMKREAEILRGAQASGVDLSDSDQGLQARKIAFEAAEITERVTRLLANLKSVELEEAKAKDLGTLALAKYSQEMIESGADMEVYTAFMEKKQELERANGPLIDGQSEAFQNLNARLKDAVELTILYGRATKAAETVLEGFRENILLAEEAELKRQLAMGKMVSISSDPNDTLPRDRAEALAMLEARQELVRQAGGNQSVLLSPSMVAGPDGIANIPTGKTIGQMRDLETRQKQDIERKNAGTDFIQSMKQEVKAQQDLIDVVNLGVRARERELAFRAAVNREQANGKVLRDDELASIRASTDALVDKQEVSKNLYGPLKQFAEQFSDDIENMQNAIVGVFGSLEDAVAEFASTGKFEIGDMIQSLIRDFTKLAMRQAITGPLANMLNNSLPQSGQAGGLNAGAGGAGGGGINWVKLVGSAVSLFGGAAGGAGVGTAATGAVGGSTWLTGAGVGQYYGGIVGTDMGMSRYAMGGIAGVDTQHAWITPGEGVFTAAQMKSLAPADPDRGKGEKETPVIVNNVFNFTNSDEESFRRSTSQIEARLANSARRATQRLR